MSSGIALHMLVTLIMAALLSTTAFAQTSIRLSARAVSSSTVSGYRGAQLVKNGMTTSCELALIDSGAGYVSANCLDYNDDGSVKDDIKYEVYFDAGNGGKLTNANISHEDIVVHPKYNHKTFANNIAIVKFTYQGQPSSWTNPIAAYKAEWTEVAYVRRQLLFNDGASWITPRVTSQMNADDGCDKASGLYKSNHDNILCAKAYTNSLADSICAMPYGLVYGVVKNSMGVGAIYSHSVVYDDNMCGNKGNQFHYYTVLSNYNPFASSVLGRDISEYVVDTSGLQKLGRSANFQMSSPDASNDNGSKMFGGDMYDPANGYAGKMTNVYIRVTATPSDSISTEVRTLTGTQDEEDQTEVEVTNKESNSNNSASATANASDDKENNANQANESQNSTNDGISKTLVIALAVALPITAIAIAITVYLIVTRCQRRHQRNKLGFGRISRQKSIHTLADEIGGIGENNDNLPLYDDLRYSHLYRNSYMMPPDIVSSSQVEIAHTIVPLEEPRRPGDQTGSQLLLSSIPPLHTKPSVPPPPFSP
ncbi:hypothetical protein GGI07_002990 [Coemansia sp. Benny D115]|nr:hypothetical protein GGI07_002990 [Coemansia sp. Benny D115]